MHRTTMLQRTALDEVTRNLDTDVHIYLACRLKGHRFEQNLERA